MQDMDVKSMSTASQRNGDVESRRKMERSFEAISPFEFRHELIKLARGHQRKSAKAMLDAGRGNPNWVAAAPREAFFALGQFAMQECRRVWDDGDLAACLAGLASANGFRRSSRRTQNCRVSMCWRSW
ncbi:hypothetical protein GCM10025858_28650 [Alicyclobacillus sacchari]|uniref:hypothetical protein n=1 Tax=Alicyclobacillus sacchari TaxID=392010 RepID=UPI0023EA155A|nr:hypothetical protein [Alicyclobacillus sacchari]GMA58362.1 hypothetical protein GCM10025858_28650 [Alicyclobacillus sacchari]